jgi:hypothetical protein
MENQQINHNDHFIVLSSQTLLHVSAYHRQHQEAHMILTSYLYVGVHYRKNNGISSKTAPVNIVTLWIKVVMTNCCWKQLVITTFIHSVTILTGAVLLDIPWK